MVTIDLENTSKIQINNPVFADKILIDLVNSIQVNNKIIDFRQKQGFFARVFDNITGVNRNRQLLTDKNSTVAIKALHDWVLELSSNLNVSNNAIVLVEEKLLEVCQALRDRQEEIDLLTDLAVQFQAKLENHEDRIQKLEQDVYRIKVRQTIDTALAAWKSKRTYQGFDWAIQIAFITREIVDYALSDYERVTNNFEFRQYIIDNLMAESQGIIPDNSFSLVELLNLAGDRTPPENKELAGYLLEVDPIPNPRWQKTPYLFALGKTLELAQLPAENRPSNPAEAAFKLCRNHKMIIYKATSKQQFIESIVRETANDRLYRESSP
jgi:hypothetical protein